MNNCENCEHELTEGAIFCTNCGQKVNETLGVKMLFENTIDNYFSLDSKILKSIPYVLLKPGVLARSFIDGHRTNYMHPAKIFLFTSVVFFFLLSILTGDDEKKTEELLRESFEQSESQNSSLTEIKTLSETDAFFNISLDDSELTTSTISKLDSLIAINAPEEVQLKEIGYEGGSEISKFFYTKFLNFYKRKGKGIIGTLIETLPLAMFLMLPVYAFILYLLFQRKEPYAHHLVLSFYQFTFIFTLMSFFIISFILIDTPEWIGLALLLFIVTYIIAGFKYFYSKKLFTAILRFVALVFIFSSLLLPLTAFLVIAITVVMY